MASPNSTFTEIVTTTLRKHPAMISDNMSNKNALWMRLKSKGRVKTIDGGYEIVRPLSYAENSTFQRYSGYETLNVNASDVLSAAKYDWKQAAVHVTASGLEMRQNAGRERILDLVQSRMTVAMDTMTNNIATDLYSSGTADGGKQIGGLQLIVADAGTGIVGGIDSSTYTFWQNQVQSAASPLQGGGAITPSASTIKSLMQPLWLYLVRQSDKPDLIVCSNNYYTYYWDALSDLQRYGNNDTTAVGGFQALKFVTADVIFDGDSSDPFTTGIPTSHMYFLNTNHLEVIVHRAANFSVADAKIPVNQDAEVVPILFQGNLCCSNRALQGVLKA